MSQSSIKTGNTDPVQATALILPSFTLTEVTSADDKHASVRTLQPGNLGTPVVYRYRPVARPIAYQSTGPHYQYNLMPVVLMSNGAPWAEATLYLLSRIEGTLDVNMDTFHGIARDLAAFRRFLDDEAIPFDEFPNRKLLRPTYRYRATLHQMIHAGELAATTARRRMAVIIGFYRWLIAEGLANPSNAPWEEHDVYIHVTDARGFSMSKPVTTTDLAVRVPKQDDPYSGTIEDGGQLRPLPVTEQEWVLEALKALGNTEMTLIHLVALFTGARIQTVLTLRVRHVRIELPDDLLELRLSVGPGTAIDTKNDKRMNLHIPRWLYEKLRVYSYSERARKRRLKSGDDSEHQYLFLSNRGVPLYTSKADRRKFHEGATLRHEKGGQAVRQYIRTFVLPYIHQRYSASFHYRFHDLRASFGMNLTEQQLRLVQENKVTLHQVREFVKTRMGHESTATTDLYLQYEQHTALSRQVQRDYEGHLAGLIDAASGTC